MRNPHSYDDEAYTEASNRLLCDLPRLLDAMWEAGADLSNIADDMGAAFENCLSGDLASANLKVEISGP